MESLRDGPNPFPHDLLSGRLESQWNWRLDMLKNSKSMVIVIALVIIGAAATVNAGDWEKAPIEDLGGFQNALTETKNPATMELGRRDRASGHPDAWGQMDVECEEGSTGDDQWCNIQLEIIFSKSKTKDRVKIQILDGDE